jgi:hypothetical protein
MKEASILEHLRIGQLHSIKKGKTYLPALGAVDIASSSLLALFPARGTGLGSCLHLPLTLLPGTGSGGGGTCVEARCDDLRATQRGDGWRQARLTLEEVETPDAGAVWEVTWLEGGPMWEAEPTWKEGTTREE